MSAEASTAPNNRAAKRGVELSQETIVLVGAVLAFLVFSLTTNSFFTYGNVINLLRTVATLGILAIGMTVVVLSRGIDLSQIANMAVFSAWIIEMMNQGYPVSLAVGIGLVAAIVFGIFNGVLVAFVEIPALFVTLASGSLLFGIGQALILDNMVAVVRDRDSIYHWIGSGALLGIPIQIIFFAVLALIVHLLLSRTSIGRSVYAVGDNLEAARITGLNVRGLIVLEYMTSALIAFLAGIIASSTVGSMDTQIFYSSRIFDVILVVVLGGVSLIGARGSIVSVIVGTLLYGILLNGMTLLNIDNNVQNLVKGFVLMAALLADNYLHPREEETARQGDL